MSAVWQAGHLCDPSPLFLKLGVLKFKDLVKCKTRVHVHAVWTHTPPMGTFYPTGYLHNMTLKAELVVQPAV